MRDPVSQYRDPAEALRWSVEMGADEAVGNEPIDRYAESVSARKAVSASSVRMPLRQAAEQAEAGRSLQFSERAPLVPSQGVADSRAAAGAAGARRRGSAPRPSRRCRPRPRRTETRRNYHLPENYNINWRKGDRGALRVCVAVVSSCV